MTPLALLEAERGHASGDLGRDDDRFIRGQRAERLDLVGDAPDLDHGCLDGRRRPRRSGGGRRLCLRFVVGRQQGSDRRWNVGGQPRMIAEPIEGAGHHDHDQRKTPYELSDQVAHSAAKNSKGSIAPP